MKDDKLYLIHISECIADIDEYTAGSRDTLMNSKLMVIPDEGENKVE